MNTPLSERLRKQLGGPRDGALLRFSLGNALLVEDDASGAVEVAHAAGDIQAAKEMQVFLRRLRKSDPA